MPQRAPVREFTPREQEIAELIGKGLSYRQIGEQLGISAGNVRGRVRMMAYLFDAYHEHDFKEGGLGPYQIVLVYAVEQRLRNSSPAVAAALEATEPKPPTDSSRRSA